MRNWIAAVVVVAGLTVVGCKSTDNSTTHKTMAGDACAMCPGVQTATADGKCPACGMKLSAMDKTMGDVCPKCPGVQTATASGTCSGCGAKL